MAEIQKKNVTESVRNIMNSIPFTTEDEVQIIMKSMYDMNVVAVKKFDSYDDLNFYVKTDGEFQNEFVLKISNKQFSMNSGLYEAQNELLTRLKHACIPAPIPYSNKNSAYYELRHLKKTLEDGTVVGGDYMVRLLTFVPGQRIVTVKEIPVSIFYDVGEILAKIHLAWKSYEHPCLVRDGFEWNLRAAPNTGAFVHLAPESWQRSICNEVLDKFEADILPVYHKLTQGIIHGDVNEFNLLVNRSVDGGSGQQICAISGVLDFGDTMIGPYIFDVGISLAYMLFTDIAISSTAKVCKLLLSGYESVSKLPDSEIQMIITIMCTRLVQSLLYGLYYYSVDSSKDYVLSSQKKGWPLLKYVWGMSYADVKSAILSEH